uniref:Uncharacterized protein n=1 Tax=Conchiformibius kuhniae TaxID=211502 RepID=A0A8T9MX31_9NEIS|nr:hypothetical protein LVJ77_11535 [Conchiformibius kuhniae]
MNTASKNRPAATQRTALRRICFVANGNAHAPLPAALPRHCVSEYHVAEYPHHRDDDCRRPPQSRRTQSLTFQR